MCFHCLLLPHTSAHLPFSPPKKTSVFISSSPLAELTPVFNFFPVLISGDVVSAPAHQLKSVILRIPSRRLWTCILPWTINCTIITALSSFRGFFLRTPF